MVPTSSCLLFVVAPYLFCPAGPLKFQSPPSSGLLFLSPSDQGYLFVLIVMPPRRAPHCNLGQLRLGAQPTGGSLYPQPPAPVSSCSGVSRSSSMSSLQWVLLFSSSDQVPLCVASSCPSLPQPRPLAAVDIFVPRSQARVVVDNIPSPLRRAPVSSALCLHFLVLLITQESFMQHC